MSPASFSEENAMTLVATMAVEELSRELGVDETTMLERFLVSRTAERLYNPELKTWWDGPASVADAYLQETRA